MIMTSCAPKEQVVLRNIVIRNVNTDDAGKMMLSADAVFYNPNAMGMKLKHIDIGVKVDGKETARIDHDVDLRIKPKSEFTVPVEVQLQQMGLLDTILGFLGGKEHDLEFAGSIRIKVKGFPVKVPVAHREKFKL
jgi:LEA14-like dessication related protein